MKRIDFWIKIENSISKKKLSVLIVLSLILCVIINRIMQSLWAIAQFPATPIVMQLSFSGEFLKDGYWLILLLCLLMVCLVLV
jgi:hypothetical protein